jgi:hypothetical protein
MNKRSTISRKGNLESENMENISFEVNINDKKWLIMGIYKAPSMSDNDFSTYFYYFHHMRLIKALIVKLNTKL